MGIRDRCSLRVPSDTQAYRKLASVRSSSPIWAVELDSSSVTPQGLEGPTTVTKPTRNRSTSPSLDASAVRGVPTGDGALENAASVVPAAGPGGPARTRGAAPRSLLRVRNQGLQIQQVLRFEGLFRPFERGVELHSDKIPDFPVDAIPYVALERLFGFIPADFHTYRNGLFHLQTSPRSANVLQDCRGPLLTAQTVFPSNLYHVRAHHTNFRSPLVHTCLIGGPPFNFTLRRRPFY